MLVAERRQNVMAGIASTSWRIDLADEVQDVDLVVLDAALSRIEGIDSITARIVELRYFGGMNIEETAEAVAHSPATVKRHWQAARIWLFNALSDNAP